MFTKLARLLTGMLCAMALVLSASTTQAAQGNKCGELPEPEKTACDERAVLEDAWFDWLWNIDDVTRQLMEAPDYETDPTGMVDIQTGIILTNIMSQFPAAGAGIRGNRPRWRFFDTPDARIGLDNPDTRYLSAIIPNAGGEYVFKITGNRGNTCDQIILTLNPSDPQGGGATLEDEDMVNTSGTPLGLDEDYVVYLSTPEKRDPSWANWLGIAASETAAVHHRYTVCNYHTERAPLNLTIDRVGTEGVSMTGEEFRDSVALANGITRATAVLANQQPFWAGFSGLIQNSGLPTNVIGPWTATGGLGITSQLNSLAWLTIPDGEALVLKVRTDYSAGYGSWMVFNSWGSSLQWGSNMVNGSFEVDTTTGNSYFMPSSILEYIPPGFCQIPGSNPASCAGTDPGNPGQAKYTTVVVSNGDIVATHPVTGQQVVPNNWINTMGHKTVYLAGRLQSVPNNEDPTDPTNPFNYHRGVGGWMPYAYLVPQAAITPYSPALPGDFAWISEDDRTAQIRERQIYQREKYAPW